MAGISAQEMPAFFIAHGGKATGRHKKNSLRANTAKRLQP